MPNIFSFLLLLLLSVSAHAARIGELTANVWQDQFIRFFHFSDPSLVTSLLGCLLMGIVLALLGSFLVLRKMSLLGDTLGHAVLPGVCAAFMITGTKAFFPIFAGALVSGLLGVLLMGWIVRASRIKPDAAMGMILSSFFGLGIVLLTMIQKKGSGDQSGLDKFLFGQAAALSSHDVWALAVITLLGISVVLAFRKEFTVVSFDASFAYSLGLPVGFFQTLMMILTAIAVVASIQAVGVVLVSAMLIIPPATAALLAKRISTLLLGGVLFGLASGFLGALFSFLGPSLPTGPFMVVAAAGFFLLAFVLAPRHGLLVRAWTHHRRRVRTQRENLLKSIYHLFEQERFARPAVTVETLAAFRSETKVEIEHKLKGLLRKKWVVCDGEWIRLSKAGREKAVAVVRRHRLWELFLVKEAHLPADHVHADAEELEHILPAAVLRQLEQALDHARFDPHGRPIP